MTTELLPCPFCGSAAEHKTYRKYRRGYAATVGCTKCSARVEQATGNSSPSYAYMHAEKAWNKRSTDDIIGRQGSESNESA